MSNLPSLGLSETSSRLAKIETKLDTIAESLARISERLVSAETSHLHSGKELTRLEKEMTEARVKIAEIEIRQHKHEAALEGQRKATEKLSSSTKIFISILAALGTIVSLLVRNL